MMAVDGRGMVEGRGGANGARPAASCDATGSIDAKCARLIIDLRVSSSSRVVALFLLFYGSLATATGSINAWQK